MINYKLKEIVITDTIQQAVEKYNIPGGWTVDDPDIISFKEEIKQKLTINQNGKCAYCGLPLSSRNPEIDHIAPKGGLRRPYHTECKMKNFTKVLSLLLALTMLLCFPVAVSAAELEDAPIDESRTGSLTIYKYDLTNAEKDGVWDSSYVSTGVFDQTGVNDVLGGSGAALGNGESGYGYAIKGVEFSYVKVADIVTFSESEADSRTDSHVEVLYAIDKAKGADFLKALNLADGAQRYTNADTLDSTKYYYQSDVLIDALAAALESNSTVVKNALEAYISANGGAAMPLTDSYGKTKAENLDLGLYLVVETKVPEMVVSTTDPFLVSVPMTSVNGTNATDGGTRWIYDITLYPKNLTGIPSLEKTLRENKNDTGKHNGSATITDGFAHTGTASAGDTIDYQIISTLPSITSESTYLSCYTFVDTLSKGLTYNKGDVVLEFFTDATCTDSVAKWTEADGKFAVAYNTTDAGESVMTIEMTAAGLNEINTSKAVYSGASMVNSGYMCVEFLLGNDLSTFGKQSIIRIQDVSQSRFQPAADSIPNQK